MSMSWRTLILSGLFLAACPAFAQELGERTTPPELMVPALAPGDDDMAEAMAAAAAFPLGSLEHPVRVGGPMGERTYLARLRCPDGSIPRATALAEDAVGGFGSIVRAWRVACGAETHRIHFDLYHQEHVEDRAPPGLGIEPA